MEKNQEEKYKHLLRNSYLKIKEMQNEISLLKEKDNIAVIGMSCRFPGGANDPDKFWDLLCSEEDAVTDLHSHHWNIQNDNKTNTIKDKIPRAAGLLNFDYKNFDCEHFRLIPKEAELLDPQQRLLLEVSWEAIENACLNITDLRGSRTGVFIGISTSDYSRAHLYSGNLEKIQPYAITGSAHSTAPGRLAFYYDLKGPNLAIDSACSSSLVALHLAFKSLREGESDIALVGGVNILQAPELFIGFNLFNALSQDGRCRTFDDSADGYGRGEGCGIIVLKREKDAISNRDNIISVIKGTAVNHSGLSNGLTIPNGYMQERVIKAALDDAKKRPEDIDYIEAHGSGTKLGDVVELEALHNVFSKKSDKILIGTVKSNIAHLEAGAGIAGFIKSSLILKNNAIPASIHVKTPNKHIDWNNKNLKINTDYTNIERKQQFTIGVSSFGFSGTNAHVIMEKPIYNEVTVKSNKIKRSEKPYILTFSAYKSEAISKYIKRFKSYLLSSKNKIEDICYTSNIVKTNLPIKLSITGNTKEDFIKKLSTFVDKPDKIKPFTSKTKKKQKILFMYTGQDSHYKEIAKELYFESVTFKEALEKCDNEFQKYLDNSFINLLYKIHDSEKIFLPSYAHAIVFSIEYALTKYWENIGIIPDAVLGYSFGEFCAACVSKAISFEDAVKMVAFRGKLLELVPSDSKMAGLLTDIDTVNELISDEEDSVSIAGINGKENITISGSTIEIEKILKKVKKQRIFTQNLGLSHGYHSPCMDPYVSELAEAFKDISFSEPEIPIIYKIHDQKIPITNYKYWAWQIRNPVDFYACIQQAKNEDFSIFMEIGGDTTLSGILSETISNPEILILSTLVPKQNAWKEITKAISKLFLRHLNISWINFHHDYDFKKVPLPPYPFIRRKLWIHTNTPLTSQETSSFVSSSEKQDVLLAADKNKAKGQKIMQNRKIEIIEELKEIINDIAGVETSYIEDDIELFSLGLDSLMVPQIRKKIVEKFQVDIKLNKFLMELTTLDKISDYLVSQIPAKPLTAEPIAQVMEKSSINSTKDINHLASENISQNDINSNTMNGYKSLFEQQIQAMSKLFSDQLSVLNKQHQVITSEIKNIKTDHKTILINKNIDSATKPVRQPLNFSKSINTNKKNIDNKQQIYLKNFISNYTERTKRSKELVQEHRSILSDSRATVGFQLQTKELLYPIVGKRANGSKLWDIDDNEYIDITMGFGVNLFGHHPKFIEEALSNRPSDDLQLGPRSYLVGDVSRLLCELTGVERVAFTNSGTEAIMAGIRLARAATNKDKIVIFSGSYHGHSDATLALPIYKDNVLKSVPVAPGIPQGIADQLIILDYLSSDSLDYINQHSKEIAAVLVEPIQSRNPLVNPGEFLQQLRQITKDKSICLFFDEMITGFRLSPGGAQQYFNVKADLVAYGKIIGGGMPIGVIAGDQFYLDGIDGGFWQYGDQSYPEADRTFFGGTFCQHPLSMITAKATLEYLKQKGEKLQKNLNNRTNQFATQLNTYFKDENLGVKIANFGSIFRIETQPNMDLLFYHLLAKGIYVWEWRSCFLSTAHSDQDIDTINKKLKESLELMQQGGFSVHSNGINHIDSKNTAQFKQDRKNEYILPMTSVEKRLFLIDKTLKNSTVYNLTSALHIYGVLDKKQVDKVIRKIISRHDSLRSSYHLNGDQFIHKIHNQIDFKLINVKSNYNEYKKVLYQFKQAFYLSEPPLIRALLIELSPEDHFLLIDMHHIIADGYSFRILVQEFKELYHEKELPPVNIPYSEYIHNESKYINSDEYKEDENFWLSKLSGELPVLNLPLDYSRNSYQSYHGKSITLKIDIEKINALKEISKKNAATLYMILFAAYTILLSKLTNQSDILVGVPVALREEDFFDEVIGMFTNTIVLRNKINSKKRFIDYLEEVKLGNLNCYAHPKYPFEKVVEKLVKERDISRHPIFDTVFSFEDETDRVIEIEGLKFEPFEIPSETAMFDILFSAALNNDGLNIKIHFNIDILKESTVKKWAVYYERILEQILDSIDTKISDISLMSSHECNKLLYEYNETQSHYENNKTIYELFEIQVNKTPNATAIIDNDIEITYSELNHKANLLAQELKNSNIAPGHIIGIHLELSIELIISILGVLKSGAAYLPLDKDYPEERIRYMVEDSKAKCIITSRKLSERFDNSLTFLYIEDIDFSKKTSKNKMAENKPLDIVYTLYTSGSTGKPKGVMVHHQGLVNYMSWVRKVYTINGKADFPLYSSISFDLTVTSVFLPLICGSKIVVYRKKSQNPVIHQIFNENRVDVVKLTPSHLKLLLPLSLKNSKIKKIIVGGENLYTDLAKRIYDKFNGNLEIINSYGPTETVVGCMIHKYNPEKDKRQVVPIGIPADNVHIYLLDSDLKPVPPGCEGEIFISGDGVSLGYHGKPNETKKSFISNPFIQNKKMYKTGDFARFLSNNLIEFIGRKDFQIKIRGYRIEQGDIQSAVSSHKNIDDNIVIAKKAKNDQYYLYCYYVSQIEISNDELYEFLKKKLPEYMIPSFFIQMDDLPLTVNGKIDLNKLPDENPENKLESVKKEHDPIEKKVMDLVSTLLPTNRFTLNDNFFRLGGNSLNVLSLITMLQKEFKVELSMSSIFEHPKIKNIVEMIKTGVQISAKSIEPITERSVNGYSVSSSQRRMFIHSQMHQSSTHYNSTAAISIKGEFDNKKFETTIEQLIKRHDSLRTSFHMIEGQIYQQIHSNAKYNIRYINLQEKQISEFINNFIKPFDMTKAPLMRLALINISESEKLLLVDIHHIIIDLVSVNNLIKEFIDIYNGVIPPALEIQYKDFADWQNKEIEAGNLDHQLSFWLKHLQSPLPVLNLPYDSARSLNQNFNGKTYKFDINSELKSKITSLLNEYTVTSYMFLLSIYFILLAAYTQSEDIIIGSPVSGRTKEETNKILGVFINTLAIRLYPTNEKKFNSFLKETKMVVLECLENQNYPFDLLVEKLNIKREPGRTPIFDTIFTLQQANQFNIKTDNLEFSEYNFENNIALVDLTLNIYEHNDHFTCELKFNDKLFKESSIKRMSDHFIQILSLAIENPNLPIGEIEMITEKEKHQILNVWNNSKYKIHEKSHLTLYFEKRVNEGPNRIAIAYYEETFTYNEINKKANKLAHFLRTYGVGIESKIPIIMERSPELIIGILGILKAGGAYIPIDSSYPQERISFILDDCEANLILTQNSLKSLISNQDIKILSIDSDKELIDNMPDTNLSLDVSINNLAYIIYTSGSTGNPKGVMIEHKGVYNVIQSKIKDYEINEQSRILQYASISFDTSVSEIFTALLSGGTLVLINKDMLFPDHKFVNFLTEQGVTTLTLTPSIMKFLDAKNTLPTIKTLVSGGEACHFDSAKQWASKYRFINAYGPTEISVACCANIVDKEDLTASQSISIGRPIDNMYVYIMNKNRKLQPINVSGELCVGGVGVSRGYLNRNDLSKEKFIIDPHNPANRLYRTGDIAHWRSDGKIEFVGRIDNQIKLRGMRIELGEIETIISKYDGVEKALVLAKEIISGNTELIAYILCHQELDRECIRNFMKIYLPDYMIPTYFIFLNELPLTQNGKIKYNALPFPKPENHQNIKQYIAPETEMEKIISAAWIKSFGMEEISVNENFFTIGGHSLKALHIISLLNEEKIKISINDIFMYPSIRELALYLETQNNDKITIDAYSVFEKKFFEKFKAKGKVITYNIENKIKHVLHIDKSLKNNIEDIYIYLKNYNNREIRPHYITWYIKPDNEKIYKKKIERNDFSNNLKLQNVKDSTSEILRKLKKQQNEFHRNFLSQKKQEQIQLSAIQQAHLSINNRYSSVLIHYDEYLDISLLEKSILQLIKNQELLRSILINHEDHIIWQTFTAPNHISLPVIDISMYKENQKENLLDSILKKFSRIKYKKKGSILYNIILIKLNLREHILYIPLDHSIYDGMSGDIIKKSIYKYYTAYNNNEEISENLIHPYSNYIKQIQKGPININETELIQIYDLKAYDDYKKKTETIIQKQSQEKPRILYYETKYSRQLTELEIWNISYTIFVESLKQYLKLPKIPLKIVSFGREYENKTFFNTVGEFLDLIPILETGKFDKNQIRHVHEKIEFAKQNNINFLNLVYSKKWNSIWRTTTSYYTNSILKKNDPLILFNFQGEINKTMKKIIKMNKRSSKLCSMLCNIAFDSESIIFNISSTFITDKKKFEKILNEKIIENFKKNRD